MPATSIPDPVPTVGRAYTAAMLPVRGDVVGRSRPFAVIGLLALNAIVFALCAFQDPADAAPWLDRWGLVPRVFLASLDGAPQVAWITPFTAILLHGGLVHLAGNALYLWIFGRAIEDLLGWQRFLVFYFACGLVAGLVHVAASPTSFLPTIGASGAISGLLGAYAVSYPTGRLRLLWPPVRVPAIGFLFLWIALQVGSGLASWGETGAGVAWWAHVGGFLAGVAWVRSMWVRRPTHSRHRI